MSCKVNYKRSLALRIVLIFFLTVHVFVVFATLVKWDEGDNKLLFMLNLAFIGFISYMIFCLYLTENLKVLRVTKLILSLLFFCALVFFFSGLIMEVRYGISIPNWVSASISYFMLFLFYFLLIRKRMNDLKFHSEMVLNN